MIDWQDYKYKAFISYSHADEKWARWLHRSLENYRVPKRLVGRQTDMGKVPTRLAPVFRDREELASATDLGNKLTQALESSAVQIVICSMASAKSHWVNEEIKAFKRLGRSDRIFSLIVDGEPYSTGKPGIEQYECFPPALRFKLGDGGELSEEPAEPIAADARHGKDGKANARVKLLAGIMGLGFDDLRQRELQRRNQRLAIITGSAVVGMVAAIGLATTAVIARNDAERQRVRAEAEAETARQTTSFLVSLFEVSDPSQARGETITAREILTAGAQRIDTELDAQPEIQARLMDTIGSVFSSLGLYQDARAMLEKALENRLALPEVPQQEIVQTTLHLAHVDTINAELETAESLYSDAIERLNRAGATDSVEMTDARAGLAELYYRMGRFEDAEPLLVSVLEDWRRRGGEQSQEVAGAIEELGLNQFDQGKFEKAEEYLRESLAMRRELFGEQPHPDLAENINNLALLLMESGRYDESEVLYLESLAMTRRLYGEKHPSLANGLNNLGLLYRAQGQPDQASKSYQESLAMRRDLFGEEHPDIAQALINLAFLSYDAGDLAGATALGRQALAIQLKVLGPTHPEAAATMSTLARGLAESGETAEAEALLRNALTIFASALPADHPDVARAQIELAGLLTTDGDYTQALQLAQTGSASLVQAYGADHWLVANAGSVQGGALAGLGRLDEAETLLQANYGRLAKDKSARVAFVMAARQRLASLYRATGRAQAAAALEAVQQASGGTR